jgi:hypothetical protein
MIENGLEKYREGDVQGAIREWDLVLNNDPENSEAENLIKFARQMMPSEMIKPGTAAPNPWPQDEKTEPESEQQTKQRVLRAELEAALVHASERSRRVKMTIESPISAFLAPLTSPTWRPSASGSGSEAGGTGAAAGSAAPRPDTVRSTAGDASRLRAAEMVSCCRAELGNGQGEAAAMAAESALVEADRAPAETADVIEEAGALFEEAFLAHLGGGQRVPVAVDSKARRIQTGKLALSSAENRPNLLKVLAAVDGVANIAQMVEKPPMAPLQCLRGLSVLLRAKVIRFL